MSMCTNSLTIGYESCLCSQAIKMSGGSIILSPESMSDRSIIPAGYTSIFEGISTGTSSSSDYKTGEEGHARVNLLFVCLTSSSEPDPYWWAYSSGNG